MLDHDSFEAWCERLALLEPARLLIARIRSLPPSRTVHSRRGNVSSRYPSRKMEVAIQFESHTVELPAIHKMDHDSNVLEFYDQPPHIKLEYEAKKRTESRSVAYARLLCAIHQRGGMGRMEDGGGTDSARRGKAQPLCSRRRWPLALSTRRILCQTIRPGVSRSLLG